MVASYDTHESYRIAVEAFLRLKQGINEKNIRNLKDFNKVVSVVKLWTPKQKAEIN